MNARLLQTLAALLLAGASGYVIIKAKMENNPDSKFTKTVAKIADICKEAAPYVIKEDREAKTWLESVTGREPKYVRLLKEAQEVLGVSDASDEFDAINKLRFTNRQLKDEINDLKQKRLTAPQKSSVPFAETRESLNEEIQALEDKIFANNEKIGDLKAKILAIFGKNNLSLTDKELEYFLISAEGDDLLTLMTIANNMKRLQELIEKELVADGANVRLAKSYTGMYLVSLDAYAHAHDAAVVNIRNYRKKLDLIFMEAESNYNEAIRLKSLGDKANDAHIESNLALNKKTLEIVRLYDNLLERRVENLLSSKRAVNQKVSVARNTYKTLANGSELINLVANANNEYSLLVNFEMPELKNIYDTGLLNAFMDISERIKADELKDS